MLALFVLLCSKRLALKQLRRNSFFIVYFTWCQTARGERLGPSANAILPLWRPSTALNRRECVFLAQSRFAHWKPDLCHKTTVEKTRHLPANEEALVV